MPPETPKLLEDIRGAAAFILDRTRGRPLAAYLSDELLRAAVERKFEIIGEALNRLGRQDPAALSRIPDHARIVAFRNVLAHGYDAVDHERVWDAIKNFLPGVLLKVEDLLGTSPGSR